MTTHPIQLLAGTLPDAAQGEHAESADARVSGQPGYDRAEPSQWICVRHAVYSSHTSGVARISPELLRRSHLCH